eukprot:678141-Rhodomonas_salina.2
MDIVSWTRLVRCRFVSHRNTPTPNPVRDRPAFKSPSTLTSQTTFESDLQAAQTHLPHLCSVPASGTSATDATWLRMPPRSRRMGRTFVDLCGAGSRDGLQKGGEAHGTEA